MVRKRSRHVDASGALRRYRRRLLSFVVLLGAGWVSTSPLIQPLSATFLIGSFVSPALAGDKGGGDKGGGDKGDNGGGWSKNSSGGDNGGGSSGGGNGGGGNGSGGNGSGGGGDKGDNGGGSSKNSYGGDNNGGSSSNSYGGDNSSQSCCKPNNSGVGLGQSSYFGGTQSSPSSITYDANRNMLQLRLKLDSGTPPDRESQRPRDVHLGHGDDVSRDMLRSLSSSANKPFDDRVHALNFGERHPALAERTLDRTLAPLERRLDKFVTGSRPKTTTVVSKTKLAIAPLSFSSTEILGINLDAPALRRAAELGFKADSPSAGGLTRLVVPPGIDAIRAKELIETELSGHRFELNRVYRLYRAAMREDAEQPVRAEPAAPGGTGACTGDRCLGRKVIQWRDNLGPCARGRKVGVIDTDIDASHPAFAALRLHRQTFAPDGRPAAPNWHGTGVLALLGGNQASGTPGLIPDADFFVASIFFSEEGGGLATDTVSLLKALQWMEVSDVKLINMSFSGPSDDLVWEAIDKMSQKGVIFVAAAGNEGPTAEPSYPAAYKPVIAVTAVTSDLRNYRHANRGNHIDVAAPGVDIWTAVPGAREGYHSGTSFAAPFVTGVLAVLPREKLSAPKEEIFTGLSFLDLGAPGRDPVYGRGLLIAPPTCAAPNDNVASATR